MVGLSRRFWNFSGSRPLIDYHAAEQDRWSERSPVPAESNRILPHDTGGRPAHMVRRNPVLSDAGARKNVTRPPRARTETKSGSSHCLRSSRASHALSAKRNSSTPRNSHSRRSNSFCVVASSRESQNCMYSRSQESSTERAVRLVPSKIRSRRFKGLHRDGPEDGFYARVASASRVRRTSPFVNGTLYAFFASG